eukprot:TRINITY_DN3852_c0_g1_i1.p1 TRINITY_DN3852_c0_g1~~TRINITY_DN3852_c0_g1_i1.p1  ORF type:complete len:1695 (+),score=302.98 TRINITY_DN3852_c0_g1_i1:60-5144(+)
MRRVLVAIAALAVTAQSQEPTNGTSPPPPSAPTFAQVWDDMDPHAGALRCIATSLRGRFIAVGTETSLLLYRVDWYRDTQTLAMRPGVSRVTVDRTLPDSLRSPGHTLDDSAVSAVALSAEGHLLAAATERGVVYLFAITQWRPILQLAAIVAPPEAGGPRVYWSGLMPERFLNRPNAVALSAGGNVLAIAWGSTIAVYGLGMMADNSVIPYSVSVMQPRTVEISDFRELTGRVAALVHSVSLSGDGQTLTASAGDGAVRGYQLTPSGTAPEAVQVKQVACTWHDYREGDDYVIYVKEALGDGKFSFKETTTQDLYNSPMSLHWFTVSECLEMCTGRTGARCSAVEFPTGGSWVSGGAGAVPYCGVWLNGRCRSPLSPGLTSSPGYDLYIINTTSPPTPVPSKWNTVTQGQFDPCRFHHSSKIVLYGTNAQKVTCNQFLFRNTEAHGSFWDYTPQRPVTELHTDMQLFRPDTTSQMSADNVDGTAYRQDGTAIVTAIPPTATDDRSDDLAGWAGYSARRVRPQFSTALLGQHTVLANGEERRAGPTTEKVSLSASLSSDVIAWVQVEAATQGSRSVAMSVMRMKETATTDTVERQTLQAVSVTASGATPNPFPNVSVWTPDVVAGTGGPRSENEECMAITRTRPVLNAEGVNVTTECDSAFSCAGKLGAGELTVWDCADGLSCLPTQRSGAYGPVRDYKEWLYNDQNTASTPEFRCQAATLAPPLAEGDACIGSTAFAGGGSLLDRSLSCPPFTTCTLTSTYDTHKGSWAKYTTREGKPGQPTYRCLRRNPVVAASAVTAEGGMVFLATSQNPWAGDATAFPDSATAAMTLRAFIRSDVAVAPRQAAPAFYSWASHSGRSMSVDCQDSHECAADASQIATGDAGACCADHSGIARCPPEAPVLCMATSCGAGRVHCCARDCGKFGGEKLYIRQPAVPLGLEFEQPLAAGEPEPSAVAIRLALNGQTLVAAMQQGAAAGKPAVDTITFPRPLSSVRAELSSCLGVNAAAVGSVTLSQGNYSDGNHSIGDGVVMTVNVNAAVSAGQSLTVALSGGGCTAAGVGIEQGCSSLHPALCFRVLELAAVNRDASPPASLLGCRSGTSQVWSEEACVTYAATLGSKQAAKAQDSRYPRCYITGGENQLVIWNPDGAAPNNTAEQHTLPQYVYTGSGRRCGQSKRAGLGVIGYVNLTQCAAACASPEAEGCRWFALGNSSSDTDLCILCTEEPDEEWPTEQFSSYYAMLGEPWWRSVRGRSAEPLAGGTAPAPYHRVCEKDPYIVLATSASECGQWGMWDVATPSNCVLASHRATEVGWTAGDSMPVHYGGLLEESAVSDATPVGCFVNTSNGSAVFMFNAWGRGGRAGNGLVRVCQREYPMERMYVLPSKLYPGPGTGGLVDGGIYYPAPIIYGVCFGIVGLCLVWGGIAYYAQFVHNRAAAPEPVLEEALVERYKVDYSKLLERLQVDIDPESTAEDCSVCLENLLDGTCVCLPCAHKFHHQCLLDYITYQVEKRRKRHPRCPNCRARVALDGELPSGEQSPSSSPGSPHAVRRIVRAPPRAATAGTSSSAGTLRGMFPDDDGSSDSSSDGPDDTARPRAASAAPVQTAADAAAAGRPRAGTAGAETLAPFVVSFVSSPESRSTSSRRSRPMRGPSSPALASRNSSPLVPPPPRPTSGGNPLGPESQVTPEEMYVEMPVD